MREKREVSKVDVFIVSAPKQNIFFPIFFSLMEEYFLIFSLYLISVSKGIFDLAYIFYGHGMVQLKHLLYILLFFI